MANSVHIPIAINEVKEAEEQPSLTYKLDLDNGRISEKIDGIDAVKQAIRKAIITPRFKCLIYNNQYGSEIQYSVLSKDATPEFIETVIPGFVKDALKPDTRILEAYDFEFEYIGDGVFIHFKADTIFGEISIEEVV